MKVQNFKFKHLTLQVFIIGLIFSLGLFLKTQVALAKHHDHHQSSMHHSKDGIKNKKDHYGSCHHPCCSKNKKDHRKSCHHPRCSIEHRGHKDHKCHKRHGHWKKWKKPFHFFGDLRLREQTDFNTVIDKDDTQEFTNDFRKKFQYRIRAGIRHKVNPHLNFVLRLRSKSQNYHSTSHNFGILNVDQYSILGIDQVYGEYDLFSKHHSKHSKLNLNFKLGKFSPPLWNQSGVYLDKDIQFDGWAMEASFLDHFSYSLGYAIVRAETKNSGFTSMSSNSLRSSGDFFLTNQLKADFSYKMSKFTFGFVMGHMNDGKENKGEVIPIALVDGGSKSFGSNNFYMLSAQLKNKTWPVHFSLGGEFLMGAKENGDKKNSRGFVLLTKAKYKKLILGANYYNVGDASAPFISGTSMSENEATSLGEFFTQDSFYSIHKSVNGYKAGVVGFMGLLTKAAWKFSDQMKLNLNLYLLKAKDSNRFLAHKESHSKPSWRTRFYLDVKF